MPSEEDIKTLVDRLGTYRATLQIYLQQLAMFGDAYTPPVIFHGVRECRDNIKRIKKALRDWDVAVEDLPDDDTERNNDNAISSPTASYKETITDLQQAQRPLQVFLCHSSKDKPAVRKLYHQLYTNGIKPWLDEEDLLPGQDWQQEISKAVHAADVVIVCLSQEAISKSGYVHKEIKVALDFADQQPEGTIFIIPLRLERCEVPERFKRWQWVDYYDDKGHEKLMRALQARASTLSISLTPIHDDQVIRTTSSDKGVIERATDDVGYSFAELLRNIRAREQLSQQQLAQRLGYSRTSIVGWESGKLPRDRTVIDKLQAEFNLRDVDVNDLLAAYVYGTTRGKISWKANMNVSSPEFVNVPVDVEDLDKDYEDKFINYKIGNIEIPVMSVFGSPQTPFRFHEVHIHYTPILHEKSDKFPKDLKSIYSYLLQEITAKYNIDPKRFTNNTLPRINDYAQGYERENDQRGDLELYFSQTTYESLWATNVAIDVPVNLPMRGRGGAARGVRATTLRKYYCKPPYDDLSASVLSNAPGVEIVVISRSPDQSPQDQLIIRRRSQKVAGYRGWYQASASGHMSLDHVDPNGLPNPFVTAVVEAKQEIADGLMISPEHFRLVGMLLKWQDLHPAFHGYIETAQTAQELLGDFRRDSFEGGLFAIPFEPRSVLRHIATEQWFPISAVAIISALLAHFPRSEVDAAARAVPVKKAEDFLLITN